VILAAVPLIGTGFKGASRWLRCGSFASALAVSGKLDIFCKFQGRFENK
jgi:hypothetical protein